MSRYAHYSEFSKNSQLETAKYAQLPRLPPKTLPFMSADSTAVNQRTVGLGLILTKLSSRPDTRYSQPFRAFIDFDVHTNFSVTPHELSRGRMNVDPRFGVVGFVTIGDYMIAAHADTTSLSRLGKIWSIVEADELGQLSIWKVLRGSVASSLDSDEAIPLGDKVFNKTLPEKINSIRMNQEGKIFLAMANGSINGYDIQDPNKACLNITAHGNSPVISHTLLDDGSIVSLSLDGSLRISSTSTGNLIGGGKLTKRLMDGEIFLSMEGHRPSGRVFLGTNKGRIIIVDVSSGSPTFLQIVTINSYPIRCLTAASNDLLLVGAGPYANLYSVLPKAGANQIGKLYSIEAANGANVHALAALPGPDSIIIVGLGDGSVCVYKSKALVYSRMFAFEQINFITIVDQTVWIGSDDGRIVEVLIPSTLTEDSAYAVSCLEPTTEEQRPLPVTQKKVESPKVAVANPSCLKKSSAVAADDSDDEWKKDLFRN